ncbi:MAG: hypothetical protein U0559_01860 [Anaerolineae bacterium]
MLTSRALDHLEETELVPSGKVTYQFSARGHELAQVLHWFVPPTIPMMPQRRIIDHDPFCLQVV